MPEPVVVRKARLEEIRLADGDRSSEVTDPDASLDVQFNPESLKVTYANTLAGGDQSGGSAIQYVSKSSTKLSVDLWFDTSVLDRVTDVRTMTKKINHFFIPIPQGEGLAPPPVRFLWGSFLFEGVMQSMDETLEFFSADGQPLRAKVALSIASQDIQSRINPLPGDDARSPGTRPQTPATEGEGLQQMLGRSGDPAGWAAVAAANGIENPRVLPPGSFVDLAPPTSRS
jgi:hypothetical protein